MRSRAPTPPPPRRRTKKTKKKKKPLRTFDFKLEDFPEVREAWLRYQTVQLREYAITWLRENDLEPVRH